MKKISTTELMYRLYPLIILGAVLIIIIIQLIRSFVGAEETCLNCNGSGIVSSNYAYNVRYEIVSASIRNIGDLDPFYIFTIKLKNIDTREGVFRVKLNFEYNKQKDEEIRESAMIKPDSCREITIKYDSKYKYDNYTYDIIAPVETLNIESVCPECNGTGFIKKKQFPFNL